MGRYALLVGIAEYQYAYALPGPVNDVDALARVLSTKFGFDVLALRNRHATRRRLLQELRLLQAQAGPRDTVVFYFSGHGSRLVAPPEADFGPAERHCFESIVPWDSGGRKNELGVVKGDNQDIYDVEVNTILRGFRTPRVTLIFDSCYAGTMSRGSQPDPGLFDMASLARRLPPPEPPLGASTSERHARFRQLLEQERQNWNVDEDWLTPRSRAVILAACGEFELAAERDYSSHPEWPRIGLAHTQKTLGCFTFHLLAGLLGAAADTTWGELVDLIDRRFRTEERPGPVLQTPRLYEGGRALALFCDATPSTPHLRIHWMPGDGGNRKDRLWLSGGAAQGVVKGSTWEIRSAWANHPSSGETVAKVRVLRVNGGSALVELVPSVASEEEPVIDAMTLSAQWTAGGLLDAAMTDPDDPDSGGELCCRILKGHRAFLVALPPEANRLTVRVPNYSLEKSFERETLIHQIQRSRYLHFAEFADLHAALVTIRCVPPRATVAGLAPGEAPALGPLTGWTWVAMAGDQLVARPCSAELGPAPQPAWLGRELLELLRLVGPRKVDDDDQLRADPSSGPALAARVCVRNFVEARARALVEDLERYAQAERIRALRAPDLTPRAQGDKARQAWRNELLGGPRIEFHVERRVGAQLQRFDGQSKIEFDEGDEFEVVLHNTSTTTAARVTLVRIDPDHSISLLLPSPARERETSWSRPLYSRNQVLVGYELGADQRIAVLRQYWMGDPRRAVARLPAGYPWRAAAAVDPAPGPVVLKLFVHQGHMEFDFLEQQSSLGDPTCELEWAASPEAEANAAGCGCRPVGPPEPLSPTRALPPCEAVIVSKDDAWGVLERIIHIHPRPRGAALTTTCPPAQAPEDRQPGVV